MPNSSMYQATYRSFYECPSYIGMFERFHVSTMCFFLVQQSGCQQTNKVVPLCQDSCTSYLTSQQNIFSNASTCTQSQSETLKAQRNDNPYSKFCSTLPAFNAANSTACSLGQEPESLQCGFFAKEDATVMCSSTLKDDPCCQKFVEGQLQNLAEVLNAPNNVWVIVAIVTGVIVILIVLFFLYIRGKRWSKQATAASRMSNNAKKLSVFGTIAKGAGLNVERNSFLQQPLPKKNNLESLYSNAPKSVYPSQTTLQGNNSVNKSVINSGNTVPPLPSYLNVSNAKAVSKQQEEDKTYSMYSIQKASKENPIRMVVIDTYNAALDDELQLKLDDVVIAEETFDDGWALGKNLTTNLVGAFPLACCLVLEKFFTLILNLFSSQWNLTEIVEGILV
ncbi:hypothetical protein HK099_008263 [Clydaea vesicula]|uniref:SH3 domain-containing protein n=1 Tax=Clydaea vesicula TaxID=447962 RepID=A0AAD5XWZ9_9FUNG|nr:hypothetical protein HK099_008263 [Clydaea vesicula]